ncbi:MAG: hypothetical protein ACKO0M_06265 [Cyanobium sp.]
MAGEPLDSLRLALMQDVLPVGLAVVDRVRRGGPREVIAAFETSDGDPLTRLRQEGEPAAREVRDNLDRLQPGLGNPVVKVSVRDVPNDPAHHASASRAGAAPDPENQAELLEALDRISSRLALLESRLLPTESGNTTPET